MTDVNIDIELELKNVDLEMNEDNFARLLALPPGVRADLIMRLAVRMLPECGLCLLAWNRAEPGFSVQRNTSREEAVRAFLHASMMWDRPGAHADEDGTDRPETLQ